MFKITPGFVRTWKASQKRQDIYKPRLHIIVHPTGRINVAVVVRRQGESSRQVIGKYPNNQLDAHQVGELQQRYRKEYLRLDDDPHSLPKDLDKREEKARELAKREAEDAGWDEAFGRVSEHRVSDLIADYIQRHAVNLKTGDVQAYMLRPPTEFDGTGGGYLGGIWDSPLDLVSRQDLVNILRGLDSTPILANRVRSLIAKLFSFGVDHGWLEVSPATNLPRNKENKRYSILSDSDIKLLWPELDGAMRLLLATGARRAEVAEMSWSDIDENVWTIPDPKQGVPHNLTLAPWQMSIFPERTTGFVWKSHRGPHITPGNITVRFIKIRNRVGLPGKSLHDMRRTVGTRIAEMTGSAEVADRVLGHVLGGVSLLGWEARVMGEVGKSLG